MSDKVGLQAELKGCVARLLKKKQQQHIYRWKGAFFIGQILPIDA